MIITNNPLIINDIIDNIFFLFFFVISIIDSIKETNGNIKLSTPSIVKLKKTFANITKKVDKENIIDNIPNIECLNPPGVAETFCSVITDTPFII